MAVTMIAVMPGLAMAAGRARPAPSSPGTTAAALPAPKVLVINRQAILQSSKVGQDIARQAQAYAAQAKADMDAQGKALQTEGQALQQQIAILAPDVKQKKIDAFQAKEAGLQAQAQRKGAAGYAIGAACWPRRPRWKMCWGRSCRASWSSAAPT